MCVRQSKVVLMIQLKASYLASRSSIFWMPSTSVRFDSRFQSPWWAMVIALSFPSFQAEHERVAQTESQRV